MPRQVATSPFGLAAVPIGHMAEAVASLKHPDRTATREGREIWAGMTFWEWPTREAMAKAHRKEQGRAYLGRTTFNPVVPLADGEGY